jgi:hypothetical protein
MTSRGHKTAEPCTTAINLSLSVVPQAEQSIRLERKLEATRLTLPYQQAYFRETFSDELWQAMEHRGLNQAEFAEKAKVQKQFLTKVFGGGNCTMDTIVNLAHALNYRAHIHLTPNDVACEWIHWSPSSNPVINRMNMRFWVGSGFSTVNQLEKEVQCAIVPFNP